MYLEIMAEMRENSVMKMSTVWNMLVPRHRFSPSGFSQNWLWAQLTAHFHHRCLV